MQYIGNKITFTLFKFHFPFLLFFCLVFSVLDVYRHLATSTMTAPHFLLPHLKAISKEPPSCTLVTLEGGRVEVATHISPSDFVSSLTLFCVFSYFVVTKSTNKVQSHLLSLLSPFLASLLAQAGHLPTISIPCSESLLRYYL